MMEAARPSGGCARARWVVGLALLALAVRWAPAFVPHFWYDEIYTIALIHNTPDRILQITAHDSHPPLYYYFVKCFAAVGRRLGGPFATLAWLRLASILPGTLACLLGWWAARRRWGARAGIWALALFALSPALVYYSIELRNYAAIHALLLAGLLFFIEAVNPRATRPRLALALFALTMLAAFYVHSLATIYLGGFGLLFLVELLLQNSRRKKLLAGGAAVGAVLGAGFGPWVPFMFPQTGAMNDATWLGWAAWSDLPRTFLLHLPLGPFISEPLPDRFWAWMTGLTGLGFGVLFIGAVVPRFSFRSLPALPRPPEDAPARGGRLVTYCAVLVVAPLMAAFFLSHYKIAKIFLGSRYNLIASPFFILLVVGLIFQLRGRGFRIAAFTSLLVVSILATGFQLQRRLYLFDNIGLMAQFYTPALQRPEARIYWTNPTLLPWCGRSGAYRLGSFEDAFAHPATAGTEVYFVNHSITDLYSGLVEYPTVLVEHLMERRSIAPEKMDMWGWAGLWRLTPASLAGLAEEYNSARGKIEARRNAIPGGQVVLADDPAFRAGGAGWSGAGVDRSNCLPVCWTEGPRQRLEWAGPEKPGRYQLIMRFWRAQPFPEKEITVRHRLPGRKEWTELRAGVGGVTIEGEVAVRAPGEKLRIELETPTWVPQKCLPGSNDPRELGMIFTALEVRPEPERKGPK